MKTLSWNAVAFSALCVAMTQSVAAQAQAQAQDAVAVDAAQPPASDAGDIVVTAQKRSESVQRVAASITALGNEVLQERAITNAETLATAVPGLQYGEHANSVLFSIRGISLDILTGAGEPSVATHIDGVYQPRASAPLIDLAELSRVEVLRGPQGTLYGRNATGGAINFVTIAPSKDATGDVAVGSGSFDRAMVRASLSGPILGDLATLRIAGSFDRNDGFSKNLLDGSSLEGRRRIYGHGALRVTPSSTLTVNFGAHYVDERIAGPVQYIFDQGPFFEAAFPDIPVSLTEQPYRVYNDYSPLTRRSMLLLSGSVEWEVTEDLTLRSITGHVRNRYRERFDGDGTSLNYVTVGDLLTGPRSLDSDSWSQEVNLSGRIGPIEFVSGLFYLREHFTPLNLITFPLGIPGLAPANSTAYAQADEVTQSYAGFADVTLHVSDRLRVVGGLRIGQDRKRYTQTFGFSLPGYPLGTGPGMACIDETYRGKWNAISPKAGFQYDLAPRVMAYAQYQRGEKSGQFNLTVCGNRVRPEKVTSYEAGIKSRLLENTLTMNVSAFHYDYSDLQVLRFVTVGGVPTSILDNAATAKVDGFELETTIAPSPRFTVNIAAAYLKSRYAAYGLGNGIDYSGNRLNRAPKWTVKSGAEYRLPLSGFLESLSVRGEVNLTDRIFFTPSNVYSLSQAPTVIVNGYVTAGTAQDGAQVKLFVRNITDQPVRSAAFFTDAQNATEGFWGAPRTWGIELSRQF